MRPQSRGTCRTAARRARGGSRAGSGTGTEASGREGGWAGRGSSLRACVFGSRASLTEREMKKPNLRGRAGGGRCNAAWLVWYGAGGAWCAVCCARDKPDVEQEEAEDVS